jgi:hydroxypyruvate isomerase
MLFTELPLASRPAAAARAGFGTVETWWPETAEVDAWAAAIEVEKLDVACLNCFAGDLSRGERGFLNIPARNAQTFEEFSAAVELAVQVGAANVNVLLGRQTEGRSLSRQRRDAVSMLREFASRAEPAGITILVEPINELDIPGYLAPTLADALTLIESAGCDRIRLLYDAYHIARSGQDPFEGVSDSIAFIGHVQYADQPGRGAPGTGEIDFRKFLDALVEAGYEGAVGLEFDPAGDTEAALRLVGVDLIAGD